MFNLIITESLVNLTKKDLLQLKDLSDAVKLDQATQEALSGSYIIQDVKNIVSLNLVSDDPQNPQEYSKTVVIDGEGNRFVTGSDSFARRAWEIAREMDGETFELKVYRRPSKTYAGREFLSCSVI